MKMTGTAIAATMLLSPALADDVLTVEPCHAIRLEYDTPIKEVYVADHTLADAMVPVNNPKLLIFTAKPRTITAVREAGGATTTVTSTSCADAVGSTTLIVLDQDGKEIFPSNPKVAGRTTVVVRWRGQSIVHVNGVAYVCGSEPPCRRR